jgi:hypothetical protein
MKNIIILESEIGPNTEYRDRVVGKSTPSRDHSKINPNLLSDIQKASQSTASIIKNPNFKVYITTAITGHRPGTRHELGLGVDIAMMDNEKGDAIGWSSQSTAKANKVLNNINIFTDELKKLGYTVNQSDSLKLKKDGGKGELKNILTFGYDGHNNHLHISNMDTEKEMQKLPDLEDQPNIEFDEIQPEESPKNDEVNQGDIDAVNTGSGYENKEGMNEEVIRIKDLIKKIL